MADDQVDQIVSAVRASPKYRTVSPLLVRDIATEEYRRSPRLKEAIKATKNKLHQVAGAYRERGEQYPLWREQIQAAGHDPQQLRRRCIEIMRHHASTNERIPLLDQFFATTLAGIPTPRSVIDVACGFNPLAIPWMGLQSGTAYYAYDIYDDMMDFLGSCMEMLAVSGHAETRDVIRSCPEHKVDLALVLKAIPCLEQVDKVAGKRILETLNADYLLVSFPARSLGGKNKGMLANYEARFNELVEGKGWQIQRFEFPTELAFLVKK